MKPSIVILLLVLMLIISSCSKTIENTHWIGDNKNNNVELLFKNDYGYIIKHYSENDTDTFKVIYKQIGDTIIISRHDSIVSVVQSCIIKGNALEFEDGLTLIRSK